MRTVIYKFADRIMANWHEWEAEAGQAAQVAQDDMAGSEFMHDKISDVLRELVEQAALVCEGRAKCRTGQIQIYNEAMKCAHQIRHNLMEATLPPPPLHPQVMRNE